MYEEMGGRLDKFFRVKVCKIGEPHHFDREKELSSDEKLLGKYDFHTYNAPVPVPSLGDRMGIYGSNKPEVIIGEKEAFLFEPENKKAAQQYDLDELLHIEKGIFNHYLDKYEQEEDEGDMFDEWKYEGSMMLANMASARFFETVLPLLQKKVEINYDDVIKACEK